MRDYSKRLKAIEQRIPSNEPEMFFEETEGGMIQIINRRRTACIGLPPKLSPEEWAKEHGGNLYGGGEANPGIDVLSEDPNI